MEIKIGNIDAGHTEKAADFICTGVNDNLVIDKALASLPAEGGSIILLKGTYNLGDSIVSDKANVILNGSGCQAKINFVGEIAPGKAWIKLGKNSLIEGFCFMSKPVCDVLSIKQEETSR